MAFVVVYDANVLYPIRLCDLLVRTAQEGLFHARWTQRILDEATEAAIRDRPDAEAYLRRRRHLLVATLRDGLVEDYEGLVEGLQLPDPDDVHVLAAAIKSHAQVIVTSNLRDFPRSSLEPYGIEAQSPGMFMRHAADLSPATVAGVIETMASMTRRPPQSPRDVLAWFVEHHGMADMAEVVRSRL